MGNTQATRSNLAAVSENAVQAKPADDAPVLVLLGLTSQDGAGDLAFDNELRHNLFG